MARKYELKVRAERQSETRRRIVEATVALHTELGPARTSLSAIAERAGVQRHTLYAHFPTELELHLACSGLHLERNPLPDAEAWLEIDDPLRRVRRALDELYEYFERNEDLLANVVRDLDVCEPTRVAYERRIFPILGRMQEVLAEPFRARGRRRVRLDAAVALALDFNTWRTLARRGGLSRDEAVELVAGALP